MIQVSTNPDRFAARSDAMKSMISQSMMTRRLIAASALTLALSACGKNERAINPDGVELAPNGKPIVAAQPVPRPPLARLYLVAFEGRWGKRTADCDVSRGDTRGTLHIRGRQIDFYALGGTIDHIVSAAPNNVTVDVLLKTSQRQSRERMNLALLAGGTRLLRTDGDGAKFLYTRC